jgi:O-antigen/teichoic acid export membrane protein
VPIIFGSAFDARPGVVAAVAASGWAAGLYVLVGTEVLLAESTKALAPVMLCVAAFNLLINGPLVAMWDGDGAAVATLLSYAALPAATALVVSRGSLSWLAASGHVSILALLLAAVGAAAVHPLIALPLIGAAAAVTRSSFGRESEC